MSDSEDDEDFSADEDDDLDQVTLLQKWNIYIWLLT